MLVANWGRAEIKFFIAKKGGSLAAIAEAAGLSAGTVSLALVRPSRAGERAISEFLGIAASQIWPDRYDAGGRRTVGRWVGHRPKQRNGHRKRGCLARSGERNGNGAPAEVVS